MPEFYWISLSLSLSPVAPTLEHRTSVKRFVSLQFHNPKKVGRTPWTGNQPVARPLPTQTKNKCRHKFLPWVGFETMIPVFERAKTVHALDRAATVIGFIEHRARLLLFEFYSVHRGIISLTYYFENRRYPCFSFAAWSVASNCHCLIVVDYSLMFSLGLLESGVTKFDTS
jgi:hypothetical protein